MISTCKNQKDAVEIYEEGKDHPTYCLCGECGDKFPLIGDSNQWHCPRLPKATPLREVAKTQYKDWLATQND